MELVASALNDRAQDSGRPDQACTPQTFFPLRQTRLIWPLTFASTSNLLAPPQTIRSATFQGSMSQRFRFFVSHRKSLLHQDRARSSLVGRSRSLARVSSSSRRMLGVEIVSH
jgi:hypothetical protein